MNKKLIIVGVLILICPFALLAAEETPVIPTEDYVIGPGDVLDISVWKNEALTKLVAVLPDGKISFPLNIRIRLNHRIVSYLKNPFSSNYT